MSYQRSRSSLRAPGVPRNPGSRGDEETGTFDNTTVYGDDYTPLGEDLGVLNLDSLFYSEMDKGVKDVKDSNPEGVKMGDPTDTAMPEKIEFTPHDKEFLKMLGSMVSQATTAAVGAMWEKEKATAVSQGWYGSPPGQGVPTAAVDKSGAPSGDGVGTPAAGSQCAANSRVINGMIIRDKPRSEAERHQEAVVISRFARKGKDALDTAKIRDRCCAPLKNKFALIDVSKLTSQDGAGGSLGSMLLAQKTCMTKLFEWLARYDVAYLLSEFPNTTDFSNKDMVPFFPRIDLRTQYRQVTVSQVASWQQFVHDCMGPADTVTSQWLLQFLTESIEADLYLQLKQVFDTFAEQQRGDVLLFKILTDILDANTYENRELYQESIKTYRLSDSPGEDVAHSLAVFGVFVELLDDCDVPSHLVKHMLNGQKHCSIPDYVETVDNFIKQLDSPLYTAWERQQGGQSIVLQQFASTLRQRYNTLQTTKKWIVASPATPIFKLSTPSSSSSSKASSHTNTSSSKLVPPKLSWQKWFLSKTCTVKDENGKVCGGNHPSKYHNDPGILTRPYDPSSLKSGQKHKAQRDGLRFKAGKGSEFKKRVYQVFEDCIDDEELMAHKADAFEHVNLAGDVGELTDDLSAPSEAEEDADTSPAMALAAMGLD